ncbi:MAG: BamA/TamA family outer membrane protein [Paludibacteraceae bacterium]|nr:BamA/TamA family outer membrane protein [Paludibacteraceae bacterium]
MLILTIAWTLAIPMSHAICLDSIMNLPAMGIPVVNYSPESTWEFGAAAQAYFRLPNQERTSIVQIDGTYSLKHQWYFNAQGALYCASKTANWQLHFRVGYSDQPATYYGIGNEGNMGVGMLREGIPYTLQRSYATIQTPVALGKDWAIGPTANVQFTDYEIAHIGYRMSDVGVGVVTLYDTRDVTFYPTRGVFFKLSLSSSYLAYLMDVAAPSRHITGHLSADVRQYIQLPHDLVVAWQFKTQWIITPYEVSPLGVYSLLPRLGGQDGLRGVNSDMFRDDVMMALQTELRIPIWSIFRATIFAGVGDVYDVHDWHWTVPKVGYGVGLRAAINKAKVNIRFDVARSNVDPRWNNINAYSFYLTATEAF